MTTVKEIETAKKLFQRGILKRCGNGSPIETGLNGTRKSKKILRQANLIFW
jgi:hypothetical protein